MALQVCVSHTGRRFHTEPSAFTSVDAFKSWVATTSSIAVPNLILLTESGAAIKTSTLRDAKQIYIYDRTLITGSNLRSAKNLVSRLPTPPSIAIKDPPDTISDTTDLQAWKDLFMARRTWALKLVDDCAKMSETTQERWAEVNIISPSVFAAMDNLQSHIRPLDQKLADAQKWSEDLQKEFKPAVENWEAVLTRLQNQPVVPAMVWFIRQREPDKTRQKASLADLVDTGVIRRAATRAAKGLGSASRNVVELGQRMDRLIEGLDNVADRADRSITKSSALRSPESPQLLQDIEALVRKVSSDYESVVGFDNTAKSISQASRSALLHTKQHLPNLIKRYHEMQDLLVHATEIRNAASAENLEMMQAITVLNGMCGEITVKLNNLGMSEEDEEALHVLSLAESIPVTYASFVAEAVKRREWNEKVKSDSSTLANEMATFQEEEERRRKKWKKVTGAMFWSDRTEGKALGLEVNLLGEEEPWPLASHEDLQEYLQSLKSLGFAQSVIVEVTRIISDLTSPTKQQTKRAKAFKAGSFHENAQGRSTLLVRGDDDLIRSLQDDKIRAESKLKGAESRVRRLEDLLHRQMSKTSTSTSFQPIGVSPDAQEIINPLSSPRIHDDLSRRSSMSSRRFSATQGPEDKAAAQRLINLEAQLLAERERASGLEKEISARVTSTDAIKDRMEEANSTKQDLLQNLEAQKREFGIERKSLEVEIRELKTKLESYEDDMDRILGSRENEKVAIDERVRSLQDELTRLRAETVAETQKAQGQVDFLRNDAKLQRESNETLAKDLQKAKEELRYQKTFLESLKDDSAGYLEALQVLHRLLGITTAVPPEPKALEEALTSKVKDFVTELDVHKSELQIAHNDRDIAQGLANDTKVELSSMEDKFKMEEMETFQLREKLASDRARHQALEAEIADERQQLVQLRSKFAAGETGSEALRSRVDEEERKVSSLSGELAAKRSRIGSLEEELLTVQDRHRATQGVVESLNIRFEARTLRAKDLTQRLYAQNDRLRRLLERMSYSITRDGESMVIQRIPRAERNSANDSSDPGSSIRRSISGIPMIDSGDLNLLNWMQTSDPEMESETYQAFLSTIGIFDADAFCDTLLRRVKEAEHAARKYTRDAKAYRDKYQRAQKEAHEKIAFKNFKEGDLALFLPTRNQTTGAWAAFNVGAPHYFLHEQDSHKLRSRDWLLARIHKIDERVVDLARSMTANAGDGRSIGEASNGGDLFDDENPFDLSDGLRWYLIDASEEKPGAPSTPGLGKSTVAATSVDATGTIRKTSKGSIGGVEGVSKTLTKSLDSRRSSSNSKKPSSLLKEIAKGSTSQGPSSLMDASGAISKQVPAQALPTDLESGEASSSKLDLGGGVKNSPRLPVGASNEVRNDPNVLDDLLGP